MRERAASAYRAARRLRNRLANRLDPPVVVLGYHRVALKAADPHLLTVSPENFRAQMAYLKRTQQLVRLEDEWSGLRERAVAVTFDDGYADNFTQALPVLEELEVPATFFVTSFLVETPRGARAAQAFWWDELARLVLEGNPRSPAFPLGQGQEWPATTERERLALHRALHALFLRSDPAERDEWLRRLRSWAESDGPAGEPARLLTADEVRTLAGSPWATVGAHTVTHPVLASLPPHEQRREITESKRQLEGFLGEPVTLFAYPFGSRTAFDATSVRLCRHAGFHRAVSTLPGQVHRWTSPWNTPRQLVRDWNGDTFAARLERFWTSCES